MINKQIMQNIENNIMKGDIECLKENINVLTEENKTNVLKKAIALSNMDAINYLIKNGVDINKNVPEEDNLLVLALRTNKYSKSQSQNNEIVNLFIDAGIDVTMHENKAMFVAAVVNNVDMLKKIIYAGADIHAQDDKLILSCASNGNIEMMNYILKEGVPIDKKSQALRIAVNYGYLNIVKLLVEKGSSIDIKNEYGNNAIRCAAMFEHIEIIQYLLEEGGKIEDIVDYYENYKNQGENILLYGRLGSTIPVVKQWSIDYMMKKTFKNKLEEQLASKKNKIRKNKI